MTGKIQPQPIQKAFTQTTRFTLDAWAPSEVKTDLVGRWAGGALAILCLAALVVVIVRLVSDEPHAAPRGGRDPVERRSQPHPRRMRPSIHAPRSRLPIGPREFGAAFESYREGLCAHEEVGVAYNTVNASDALDHAWTQSSASRSGIREQFTREGLLRAPSKSLSGIVAEAAGSARLCSRMAAIDVITIWPELEPGDFLAQVFTASPDSGVLALTLSAIDAAAETGRADYVPLLEGLVSPSNDSRIVWHSIRSIGVITGSVGVANRVVEDSWPFDAELANALPIAFVAAPEAEILSVADRLKRSHEPLKRNCAAALIASLGH